MQPATHGLHSQWVCIAMGAYVTGEDKGCGVGLSASRLNETRPWPVGLLPRFPGGTTGRWRVEPPTSEPRTFNFTLSLIEEMHEQVATTRRWSSLALEDSGNKPLAAPWPEALHLLVERDGSERAELAVLGERDRHFLGSTVVQLNGFGHPENTTRWLLPRTARQCRRRAPTAPA